MSEQPGNFIPTYPKAKPYPEQDPNNACDPTSGFMPGGGESLEHGGPGGAQDWVSHPGKEESFTIDTNELKWPANTEASRIAKRPK